jgi:hypothetical protein
MKTAAHIFTAVWQLVAAFVVAAAVVVLLGKSGDLEGDE